ncbi:glutathionylspermidine synthase family protein [Candidatus Desantisbacteria bacterium]|nr:glutathionylspermidine synthase family protein [Candidatus Desantisbacteria bacterium]
MYIYLIALQTENGWAVSEVNSDVPGGFSETESLPRIVSKYFHDKTFFGNVGESLLKAFLQLLPNKGRIAFVYATSYSDDRQVMLYLSQIFKNGGFECVLIAPDHLRWDNNKVYSIAIDQKGVIDGIVRFFPIEWMRYLPESSGWKNFFSTKIPSCNHPVSILTQSKRLPLVWKNLNLNLNSWE